MYSSKNHHTKKRETKKKEFMRPLQTKKCIWKSMERIMFLFCAATLALSKWQLVARVPPTIPQIPNTHQAQQNINILEYELKLNCWFEYSSLNSRCLHFSLSVYWSYISFSLQFSCLNLWFLSLSDRIVHLQVVERWFVMMIGINHFRNLSMFFMLALMRPDLREFNTD